MLENTFVGRPPGNCDRLMDFSRAVTATLFFAPPATFLEDVPAEPEADAASAEPAPAGGESAAEPQAQTGSVRRIARHWLAVERRRLSRELVMPYLRRFGLVSAFWDCCYDPTSP
jgi:hypothetical protein